jgi:hypothetical protein
LSDPAALRRRRFALDLANPAQDGLCKARRSLIDGNVRIRVDMRRSDEADAVQPRVELAHDA